MKLDDAYNAWGNMSENRELAQKTKKIFHNIWWLVPTNKPCNYYTLEVLGRALVQANGAQSDKVKAASVMCHVLNYAHNVDPEGNNKPDFTFSDIVNYTGEKEDKPLVKVKPAAKAKRMAELAKRDGGEAATKAAKAVVQLDAETLQVVKVWPSCFAAQKEMGIKNVQRAISRCGIAGGFYWCRPGDEEGFKPLEKRGRKKGKNNTKTEKAEKPKKFTEEEKELHRKVFNRETEMTVDRSLAEQTREDALPGTRPLSSEVQSPGIERPQPETLQEAHDNLQQAINEHVDQVLQKCTDDELIAELRRREWHGTLRITRTIEL